MLATGLFWAAVYIRLEIFQHHDHNLENQDQLDQDHSRKTMDKDQDRILLVWDRSCNKTKVSDHIAANAYVFVTALNFSKVFDTVRHSNI